MIGIKDAQGSYMSRNKNEGINQKVHVFIQPNIGIHGDARNSVVELLNTFLADEAILTMKTYRAYWHLRGPGFLDLHKLLGQQCRQLENIANPVAERIWMLGGSAVSSFEAFLHHTRLSEQPDEAFNLIYLLADHEALIRYLREDARKCLEEYEDHGTYSLLVRFLVLHEKIAWMLRTYIEPDMTQTKVIRAG